MLIVIDCPFIFLFPFLTPGNAGGALKTPLKMYVLPKYFNKKSNGLSYFSGIFHVKGKRGRNITDIMMK